MHATTRTMTANIVVVTTTTIIVVVTTTTITVVTTNVTTTTIIVEEPEEYARGPRAHIGHCFMNQHLAIYLEMPTLNHMYIYI